MLLGIGAYVGYSFIKGHGIFNKPRFYFEHKALKKYLDTNYPESYCGDITKVDDGWLAVVNDRGHQFMIHMSKSADGTYLFMEKEFNMEQN